MSKTGNTVTRADLVNAVYAEGFENRLSPSADRLSRDECALFVESLLQDVSDALVAGETVKLSSFGAFSVREKAERIGRNPKTGEGATISPRRVLTFRASNVLKDALNGGADASGDPDMDDEPSASSAAANSDSPQRRSA